MGLRHPVSNDWPFADLNTLFRGLLESKTWMLSSNNVPVEKSPLMSGSFEENDLQLKTSYGSRAALE